MYDLSPLQDRRGIESSTSTTWHHCSSSLAKEAFAGIFDSFSGINTEVQLHGKSMQRMFRDCLALRSINGVSFPSPKYSFLLPMSPRVLLSTVL